MIRKPSELHQTSSLVKLTFWTRDLSQTVKSMVDVVKKEFEGNDESKKQGKTYHSMVARKHRLLRNGMPKREIEDFFTFMGLKLIPINHLTGNGKSNTSKRLQCFSLSTPEAHIFRLSVDPGVNATCEDLVSALQSHVLNPSDSLSLPSTIKISGSTYNVSYIPPHGDELLFGERLCDTQWIGTKCLGTAIISPAPIHHSPCDLSMLSQKYTRKNKNTFSSLRRPQR